MNTGTTQIKNQNEQRVTSERIEAALREHLAVSAGKSGHGA
jgi:hypothetical protein